MSSRWEAVIEMAKEPGRKVLALLPALQYMAPWLEWSFVNLPDCTISPGRRLVSLPNGSRIRFVSTANPAWIGDVCGGDWDLVIIMSGMTKLERDQVSLSLGEGGRIV
jgi:hypothetical protein